MYGQSLGASITLPSVTIGGLTQTNKLAAMFRGAQMPRRQLGQSFISKLAGFNFDGKDLVLKGK